VINKEDERAKFTKGETPSVDKILYEKLRVQRNWKTQDDISDKVVGD
jgi:hypothetical protein